LKLARDGVTDPWLSDIGLCFARGEIAGVGVLEVLLLRLLKGEDVDTAGDASLGRLWFFSGGLSHQEFPLSSESLSSEVSLISSARLLLFVLTSVPVVFV